ncbi:MAG: ribonuclease T2 [Rhizobiales bacterium]|nr:ribonuclease T2 [Hyphomicrobiales bacterium]
MRFVILLLLLVASTVPATARSSRSGDFDYLVLALSWSPTYCASPAGENDNSQCGPGRRFAFVVHGLWPQYTQGWPQDCATDERWVDERMIRSMMDIMPSKRLIIHEWKKHGTCAGVSQSAYFNAIRSLFAKVRIPARYLSPAADVITTPEQLVTDFVKTNRDLTSGMVSVQCGNSRDRARLSELRICLDKAGKFAACGPNENRSCRARTLVMPRVR